MSTIRRQWGSSIFALLGALTLGASAQAQGNGLVWRFASDGTWIADAISVGNEGTQVFTEFGASSNSAQMLSAHDADPPAPVWVDQQQGSNAHRIVASSHDDDVHVSMHQRFVPGSTSIRRAVLRKYSSALGVHDWIREIPVDIAGHSYSTMGVSTDGQRIVAAVYDFGIGKTRVELLGAGGPTPLASHALHTSGPFKAFALSSDGSKVLIASDLRLVIADTTTGAVELSTLLTGSPNYGAVGISGDGSIAAYGTMGSTRVYTRGSNGTYQLSATLQLPTGTYCRRLGISNDGSTLALGLSHSSVPANAQVRAYDLATGALTMERVLVGGGTHQNHVEQIALSADGRRFAVGLWGDEAGLVPEVQVFRRNLSEPIFSYDLPGSVNTLDFSPSGDYLAVASKGVHANVAGGGGSFWLFSTGSNDLRLEGVPSIGSQVDVVHFVDPGAVSRLLVAPQLAAQPASFGRTGVLHLDRSSMSFLGGGVAADNEGLARHPLSIPNDPSLIGTSLYFQGLDAGPRELSTSWVKMTILP